MIKVKDFKAGETAYLLDYTYNNHGQRKTEINEVTVEKVGRKYVTCRRERYQESDNDDGLVGEYWSAKRLFPTKEAAENKLEKDRICSWIVSHLSYEHRVRKYSLEQLRQVKQILDPDN